jgi:excisionase family DNA binding protein
VKLLTVREAAAILGVKPVTVYALCAAKKIRHERIGVGRGAIRIPPDAIDEYRKRQTVAVEEDAPRPAPPVRTPLRHLRLS